jgi:DNA-binding transcriptional ArsR family regulator
MGRSQDEVDAVIATPATPLDHRLRRCILRCLNGSGPLTPAEISTELTRELSEIVYHLRVLAEYEMVSEKQRGIRKVETSFESQISDDAEIVELLISTRAEDEARS